jgi:hypothetical protein
VVVMAFSHCSFVMRFVSRVKRIDLQRSTLASSAPELLPLLIVGGCGLLTEAVRRLFMSMEEEGLAWFSQ